MQMKVIWWEGWDYVISLRLFFEGKHLWGELSMSIGFAVNYLGEHNSRCSPHSSTSFHLKSLTECLEWFCLPLNSFRLTLKFHSRPKFAFPTTANSGERELIAKFIGRSGKIGKLSLGMSPPICLRREQWKFVVASRSDGGCLSASSTWTKFGRIWWSEISLLRDSFVNANLIGISDSQNDPLSDSMSHRTHPNCFNFISRSESVTLSNCAEVGDEN